MNISQSYILISIIVLLVIMIILMVVRKKRQKPLSTIAAIAFSLIIAGIAFGENKVVGYSFIGAGIVLAVIDMIREFKKSAV